MKPEEKDTINEGAKLPLAFGTDPWGGVPHKEVQLTPVCPGSLKCPEIDALGELNFRDEASWNIAVNEYCERCQGKAPKTESNK